MITSYQINDLQIFSPFCSLPFHVVNHFSFSTEAFSFDLVVPLVFGFACVALTFWSNTKNHCED